MVVLELLKDVLARASMSVDLRNLSKALMSVMKNVSTKSALLDQAAEVIDSYFTQGADDSVFLEPAYMNSFNTDLNAFLKWEKLGSLTLTRRDFGAPWLSTKRSWEDLLEVNRRQDKLCLMRCGCPWWHDLRP
jgi:hypothetical protein